MTTLTETMLQVISIGHEPGCLDQQRRRCGWQDGEEPLPKNLQPVVKFSVLSQQSEAMQTDSFG